MFSGLVIKQRVKCRLGRLRESRREGREVTMYLALGLQPALLTILLLSIPD